MTKYMFFHSILLMTIFSDMNNYQNLSGKTEKISQYMVDSALAILFWNRSRDCSVYTTLEDGVLLHTPAQVFQRT